MLKLYVQTNNRRELVMNHNYLTFSYSLLLIGFAVKWYGNDVRKASFKQVQLLYDWIDAAFGIRTFELRARLLVFHRTANVEEYKLEI